MRILPLFILPHTADAANTDTCQQGVVTGQAADGTKGVYIVGGTNVDIGCKVPDATVGNQFPLKWQLKIDETKNPNGTEGQWLHGESENYLTQNGHGIWATADGTNGYAADTVTEGAATFINMHLHGEQIQTGAEKEGNYCYCGDRGGGNVLGRGNWKKDPPVDITLSGNANDVVWVAKAVSTAPGNFGASKVCLCKSANVVHPLMENVTEATKLLKHGEIGDPGNEKVCSNLLYEFDGADSKPLAKVCETTEFCDQFGGIKVCVPTDDQLFITQKVVNGTKKYWQADGTKKYCVRHMTGTLGDVEAEDKRAFRPRDTNDISAPDCAAGTYCNPYAESVTTRCLPNAKVLGDDDVVSAVRAKGKADEHCLGIGAAGSKICPVDTHLCNPHADTKDNLCVESTKVFKHAEAGDPDKTPVPKTTCIADNALHKKCEPTQVCNYGAEIPAHVCLASAALVGTPTIAKGVDNWNAIKIKSLRQEPGTASQLCMARASGESFSVTTPGGKSFSKQCVKNTDAALAEVCNPNANSLADVCIKKNKVVANHGDQVDFAANPPRVACIGDTHYKLDLAKGMICNMGVTNAPEEVEIKVEDTLSGKLTENNIRKEGFNKVGEKVANAEIFKWCFDNTQADRCTDKQTCNTAGTYDDDTAWTKGTDANATCVDTEAIIEHGGKGDETKMYCLGQDTSEKYTKVDTEDTPKDQCSRATGKLHKADEQLADGAVFDTEKPTEERCFATASEIPFFYDANCKDKFVCNPTGSSSEECGSEDAPCSLSNICVSTDAQLPVNGKFDEEKATVSICLVEKTANQCTAAMPYCQEDGTCLETAASGSGGDDSSESENVSGSSTASLVGLSVAAILSA